jgi:DNA-binding GntR family transcriptional regulator
MLVERHNCQLSFIDYQYNVPLRNRHSKIVPKTVVEQVHDAVLEMIFDRRFSPGDRVTEASLARELGVGQATVNQVLIDLDSKAIVSKTLNKETRINSFALGEIEALYLVRRPLEAAAVEAAARQATPETERRLRIWVEKMRKAAAEEDFSSFYLADYRFHQEVYLQSKNRFIIKACQAIAVAPFAYVLIPHQQNSWIPFDYFQMATDHDDIIDSILDGPAAAVRTMSEKLEQWLKAELFYLENLDSEINLVEERRQQ